MLATAVILFLLFGSVVLPLKAVLMTLLSATASFGALVWIFQDGNLANVLAFQSPGFTVAGIPIIMFCVIFGLSMDYECCSSRGSRRHGAARVTTRRPSWRAWCARPG